MDLHYGPDISVDRFREIVISSSTCSGNGCNGCCIIVSYARSVMNQTGSGHFSPIGGYHREKDMVLIMDVARFKYPPHWVPLELLHEAMCTIDDDSGKYRGCMVLTPSSSLREKWCCKQDPDSGRPVLPAILEGGAEGDEELPHPPGVTTLADEPYRGRSDTGAAIGALWGISDGSSDGMAKDNPIMALLKHRCTCCR